MSAVTKKDSVYLSCVLPWSTFPELVFHNLGIPTSLPSVPLELSKIHNHHSGVESSTLVEGLGTSDRMGTKQCRSQYTCMQPPAGGENVDFSERVDSSELQKYWWRGSGQSGQNL